MIGAEVRSNSLPIKGLRFFACKKTGRLKADVSRMPVDFPVRPIAANIPRCDSTRVPSSRTAHGSTTSPMLTDPMCVARRMERPSTSHRFSAARRAMSARSSGDRAFARARPPCAATSATVGESLCFFAMLALQAQRYHATCFPASMWRNRSRRIVAKRELLKLPGTFEEALSGLLKAPPPPKMAKPKATRAPKKPVTKKR